MLEDLGRVYADQPDLSNRSLRPCSRPFSLPLRSDQANLVNLAIHRTAIRRLPLRGPAIFRCLHHGQVAGQPDPGMAAGFFGTHLRANRTKRAFFIQTGKPEPENPISKHHDPTSAYGSQY